MRLPSKVLFATLNLFVATPVIAQRPPVGVPRGSGEGASN